MASQSELDRVLMGSALLWASLSTCSRLNVGCVIADECGRIVSSGYNGAPAGERHCDHACDCGHEGLDDMFHFDCPSTKPCKVAIHSEDNALKYADVPVIGYTMFCTHSPCLRCAGLVLAAGIGRVVFLTEYRDTRSLDVLRMAGIEVEQYSGEVLRLPE